MRGARGIGACLLATAVALTSAPTAAITAAAPILVRVGDRSVRTERLAPGAYRYLRYKVKDGHRIAVDIWNRTVDFETREGRRLLHLTQRWDEVQVSPSGAVALDQDSWFDAATLRPVTHVRRATLANGSVTVVGYRFEADKAVGMTDLPGNARAGFSLAYAEAPFNFEYDMELLQTLPLATSRAFSLPFYDAGIDAKADRYVFRVAGSAAIRGWDGRSTDCWLVTADYNTGEVKSRFWFAKQSQLLIREEARLPDGSIFIKTLLPPEAGDLPSPAGVVG